MPTTDSAEDDTRLLGAYLNGIASGAASALIATNHDKGTAVAAGRHMAARLAEDPLARHEILAALRRDPGHPCTCADPATHTRSITVAPPRD